MNDHLPSTPASCRASWRSHRVIALARVRRWKWILAALVIGPLAAWLWGRSPDALTASGYSISQAQFESGLLRVVKHPETGKPIVGRDGEPRRYFEDITVYPTNHRDAYGRHVSHLITGSYTNGRVEGYKDAGGAKTREIRWRDAFFPAPGPYEPLTPAQQPASEASGSVRDYLDGLHVQGVRYRHAWWHEPGIATPLFTAASALLIGGVWPTLLSLAAFGTLVPPRDGPASHLRPATSASASAPTSQPDFAAVQSLANALEAQLAAAATPSVPPRSQLAPAHPSAPQLESSPPAPLPHTPATLSKAFGQGQDDFYPTELKPTADPPAHPPPSRAPRAPAESR